MADSRSWAGGAGAPPPPAVPPRPPAAGAGPVPEPESEQRDGVNPLWLPGWESYSTWGWDSGVRSWYAQLYRDSDDRDGPPRVWLDGAQPIPYAQLLYARIAVATGEALSAVYEAMLPMPTSIVPGHREPADPVAPGGRTLAEIRHQLHTTRVTAVDNASGPAYEAGRAAALRWLLGEEPAAPCSGAALVYGGRPAPLTVAAEAWAATAAVYGRQQAGDAAGAEAVLRWALGRSSTP